MRLRPYGLLLSGVVVATSACSVDATAPSTLAPSAVATRSESWSNGGSSDSYLATIDPQRPNVLHFGPFTLELPANAICNQDSGYGLDVFDLDCKTEKDPVRIRALVRTMSGGLPRIDFIPEMRFSPKRVVTLTVSAPDGPMPASPRFLYCATITTTACVDETALDQSLATSVDEANRTVFRRIKHFSGYFLLE